MKSTTLKQLLADRTAKRPVVLATSLDGETERLIYAEDEDDALYDAVREAMRSDKSRTVESDGGAVFLHVFNPPLRMVVVGAVHIAQPLVRMAMLAGYDVTVIDPRGAFANAERFPDVTLSNDWPDKAVDAVEPDRRTAVVTLTHDPKLDDPALARALRSDAFYIGALGSTRTHAKRLERLTEEGFGADDFARINGPVGLNIGAKSPAEIAISIMGQITSALRQEAQAV